jgi:hypothetical protein
MTNDAAIRKDEFPEQSSSNPILATSSLVTSINSFIVLSIIIPYQPALPLPFIIRDIFPLVFTFGFFTRGITMTILSPSSPAVAARACFPAP